MFEAKRLCSLLFVLLLFAGAAFGQEFTGNIDGRVDDASGAVIPGVSITLTSPAIQGSRQAVSGEAGNYQFRLLPAGTYAVKFELAGFKTIIRDRHRRRSGRRCADRYRRRELQPGPATRYSELARHLDRACAVAGNQHDSVRCRRLDDGIADGFPRIRNEQSELV